LKQLDDEEIEMESCVVIANKSDLVRDPKVLQERTEKLRQMSEYFDIQQFFVCSLKNDDDQIIKKIFFEICESLWKNKLCDPRYMEEFKVIRFLTRLTLRVSVFTEKVSLNLEMKALVVIRF
jgi:hypothetical protein